MGKKKGAPKKQVNPRISVERYRKLEALAAKTPGESVTSMAGKLLEAALADTSGQAKPSIVPVTADELDRVMEHHVDRLLANLDTINRNVHDATRLVLTPRHAPAEEPQFGIDNAKDAQTWVEKALKPLPD